VADPNEQAENEAKARDTEGSERSEAAEGGASATATVDAGETAEGGESDAAAEAAAPIKKKTKKAKSSEPEVIRDRNRRIREEAAAKRRVQHDERRVAAARNLDTSELVDDALARTTHAVTGWLKRNLNLIQWVVVLSVVAGIGYQIYAYRHDITVARATDELMAAVRAENGRVGEGAAEADSFTGVVDTRPVFPTEEARLKAAAESYRKVQSSGTSTTSTLASLGLAGVLFDQKKFKDARAEYQKVKGSPLAQKDRDVRGRVIEGIGLTFEAEGQIEPALTAFRELENTDIPGFGALGQYHQARLLLAKGDREKAKQLLTKAQAKLKAATEGEKDPVRASGGFFGRQVQELLASVDPSAVPKPSGGLTPEQLQRLQEQLKLQSADGSKLDPQKLQELLSKLGAASSAPAAPPAPAPSGGTP
jgi:predicted negative regulator of RcsB-dependent stress response